MDAIASSIDAPHASPLISRYLTLSLTHISTHSQPTNLITERKRSTSRIPWASDATSKPLLPTDLGTSRPTPSERWLTCLRWAGMARQGRARQGGYLPMAFAGSAAPRDGMGWTGGGGWLDWVGLARQMSEKEAIANSMLVSHNARAHCLDARLLLACLLACLVSRICGGVVSTLQSVISPVFEERRRRRTISPSNKPNRRQETKQETRRADSPPSRTKQLLHKQQADV
ncbi:hypothetical protein IWX47DRAFT_528481 [Phyllosticta citricarpa]